MSGQDPMPDRLGAYRLLDRIGEGGMGVVYLAKGPGQRTVALKVLRSTVAGDPTARRRLAREVETMQRVRSPYVAEVIDADLAGDLPYIVTQYVPGRTLEEVVNSGGPLPGPVLSSLACGLAEALVAVHAAGVVHRDVKPSNVMLLKGSPVVIDFGIAQGPDATRLTLTGMFMGTPGYLAPEVIEGGPSSVASDVHAWGATVAFASTGRPPYGTGPFEGIFYRIVHGQPDLAGAPASLLPLLASALARDPAHRPSAGQLSAQARLLDPSELLPSPPCPMAPEAAGNAGGNVTRIDAAPGPADAAAASAAPGPPAAAGNMPLARDVPAAVGVPAGGSLAAAVGAAVPGAGPVGLPGSQDVAAGLAGPPAAGLAGPLTLDLAGPLTADLAGSPPAGLAGATAGQLGNGAAAAVAGPASLGTRPLAASVRPLADDLADVLPPVHYEPLDGGAQVSGGAVAAAAVPSPRVRGGLGAAAAPSRGHHALVFASMVILASLSVVLPIAGTLAALAIIVALRTSGLAQRRTAVRRQARGTSAADPFVSAVAMPWFIARALLTSLLLAPFAVVAGAVAAAAAISAAPQAWPSRALAFGAGALVAFYGLGPGSAMPRSQLSKVFAAAASTRTARLVAVAGAAVLAVAAFIAALSWPSLYWPTLTPGGVIHIGIIHLGPLHRLGLLRRIGLGHRIVLLSHLFRWPFGLFSHAA